MPNDDYELEGHKIWMGLLQPVGLVVAPIALRKAQAVLSRNVTGLQRQLIEQVTSPVDEDSDEEEAEPAITDLPAFFRTILEWHDEDIAGAPNGPELPEMLTFVMPDYQETLRPDYAIVSSMEDNNPLILVQNLARSTPFDSVQKQENRRNWDVSPQAKHERLLREVKQPVGLLCNGDYLRLTYAPSGETSGHLTFPIAPMCEVIGRPMLSALEMLLSEHRVIGVPDKCRLHEILAESRKYQAEVSTALSEQVLNAQWHLLRGYQASDDRDSHNFEETAREQPEHVYGGLLTLLMRLIFVLYAEDKELMPTERVYANNYAVSALYDRLRKAAASYPDLMDQRFGAYAWLLSLFRLIFDGGGNLPSRHGELFNPDAYPFLEGRAYGEIRVMGEKFPAPRVTDGTIYRVLESLLILKGERLSYRTLDVETIGSVYEAMMGYRIERAMRPSLGLGSYSVVVDLNSLLAQKPNDRSKYLKAETGLELTAKNNKAIKAAETKDQLVEALSTRISKRLPLVIQPGEYYLQPGEERRKTGSHYTPRELTGPMVGHTLDPVLADLGSCPKPEQILALKVCDPAMGSGAFLVEASRYLGEKLEASWDAHLREIELPADESRSIHAIRLVVGRCIYGIDKNPFAVTLAKLSLWLVTLAKSQPFTFLDHALKCGDTLLGLSREQITAFQWHQKKEAGSVVDQTGTVEVNSSARRSIQALGDGEQQAKQELHRQAEEELDAPRLVGDLILAAFFTGKKKRETTRRVIQEKVSENRSERTTRNELEGIRSDLLERQRPFHLELEFPEVFERKNPGFDAIVGNPPFCGGTKISSRFGDDYRDWLKQLHAGAHGNGDLVAHFFRRAFNLLRKRGTFGLIATNTIAQGDTRNTGLTWICEHAGTIYNSNRRYKWPGAAAVVVSTVCVRKGKAPLNGSILDGQASSSISAFLVRGNRHANPEPLKANKGKSFAGAKVYGNGFTFDDSDAKATSIAEMKRLIAKDPRNQELIQPYIGGSEVNTSPSHEPHRYVINFKEMELEQAGQHPALLEIVERKVKPGRDTLKDNPIGKRRKKYWWRWGGYAPALIRSLEKLSKVLAISETTTYLAFTFIPATYVPSQKLKLICYEDFSSFCVLQASIHETWARAFGSTMKDDLVYTTTDCFETYPFPENWQANVELEAAGEAYFTWRAELMVRKEEGMTKIYNRYHDPNNPEPAIEQLRALHRAMDRAVLAAYGWDDLTPQYEFLLDYEIDEETWGTARKPYRYRWPDAARDEVMSRLLELNGQRN